MPGRPSKSISNTTGKYTVGERKRREEAEKSLLTGITIRERPEVAANEAAHAEFLRVSELLSLIDKNDALIETVINRYCMILAECADFERKREKFNKNLDELMESDMGAENKFRLEAAMQKSILDLDRQVQTKRRMLFDIERENGFTIAAALRSIPKKADTENPLLKALREG